MNDVRRTAEASIKALAKKIDRSQVANWRRRLEQADPAAAREPLERLVEVARANALGAATALRSSSPLRARREAASVERMRAVLLAGGAIALVALVVLAVAPFVRRRRAAGRKTEPREWVAVPIETGTAATIEEAIPLGERAG